MKGSLTRPTGDEEPIELKLNPQGQLVINFTPKEEGLHKVCPLSLFDFRIILQSALINSLSVFESFCNLNLKIGLSIIRILVYFEKKIWSLEEFENLNSQS